MVPVCFRADRNTESRCATLLDAKATNKKVLEMISKKILLRYKKNKMQRLKSKFSSRDQLIKYLHDLVPWLDGDESIIIGGYKESQRKLKNMDPNIYCKTRNFGSGKVTELSPYISHGIISLNEVRNYALSKSLEPKKIIKFIQELGWRDFWQRIAEKNPEYIWNSVENYKTGFVEEDYLDFMPEDITCATTNIACINSFIQDLLSTGYVHNHARMYIASYVVHFRRIKWQTGAKWFLKYLLDGDEASNNLSWQWVASTFSNKPYIFNLDNVRKYFRNLVDTSVENNKSLNESYENISKQLFPKLKGKE